MYANIQEAQRYKKAIFLQVPYVMIYDNLFKNQQVKHNVHLLEPTQIIQLIFLYSNTRNPPFL